MTDEQIKQNAEEYADSMKEIRGELEWCATRDDFIAGAHSRDEEIKRLYNSLEHFRTIINNLRHPWISIEDRLPEEGQKILVLFRSGAMIYDECFNEHEVNLFNVTHWMLIPELKKKE